MEETAEAWRSIVAEKGGVIVKEPELINGKRYVTIRCTKGHVWRPKVNSVAFRGNWCTMCRPCLTIGDMRRIAEARGGRCLSTEYRGNKTNLEWECTYEHRWNATPGNVKNHGSWCPHCVVNVGEELVRATFEEAFPGRTFERTRKEPWMHGLELDGFNEELRIAFEYQGIQHAQHVEHFHRDEGAFEAQVMRDQLTADRCLDEMVVLLTIPHTVRFKDIRRYVRRRLEKLGWPFALGAMVKSDNEFYDSVRAQGPSNEKQYARICAIAIRKGGVCLSEKYISNRVPMHFRCGEGHEFDATPESIDQPDHRGPRFCPVCGGTRRKGDDELRTLVESCGWRFVSVSSQSVGGRMRRFIVVICPNGHKRETLWDNFSPKNGVPKKKCAECKYIKNANSKRADRTEWIQAHNLVLEDTYQNRSEVYNWVCGNGHKFKGSYSGLEHKATPCTPCRLNEIAEEANLELLTVWNNEDHNGATVFQWKCNHCGNAFDMCIAAYGRRKHPCPHCK